MLCSKCGEDKSSSDFYKDNKSNRGFFYYCKTCTNLSRKLRYESNIESEKLYRKLYYQSHKELYKGIHKRWKSEHPDKMKEYQKKYVENNVDKVREAVRKSQKKNIDRVKGYIKKWFEDNPLKRKEYHQNRRARTIGNGGTVSSLDWKSILSFYGNVCLCCGRSDVKLTQDHVVPLKLGGIHSVDNLQPLCGICNSRKSTKVIDYRKGRIYST